MEGSSAPAIGSRRFAAWADRESAVQLGIRAAERRERPASQARAYERPVNAEVGLKHILYSRKYCKTHSREKISHLF